MKKIVFSFLIIILFSAAHPVWSTSVVNRIVALVDGKTITLFELQSRLRHLLGLFEDVDIDEIPQDQLDQTRRQVLEQMVNDILLKKEAEKYGIEVGKREIENHIREVRSENNLSMEEFEEHLESEGLTLEAYKEQISDSIIRQRVLSMMVRRKVMVTSEEIESFYQKYTKEYQEEKISLQVILVPDVQQAESVREKITQGEMTFDQAAENFSKGPNASEGGDLGTVNLQNLAPEWQQALENLDPGEISSPFEVRGSGALLKLKETHSSGAIPLSEVEDKIREQIFNAKLDSRFEEYIEGLREKAVIDIRL
ncbi:MAG: SurA N-terminal domain-containing protein [Desulfonatronovibrio sp.]